MFRNFNKNFVKIKFIKIAQFLSMWKCTTAIIVYPPSFPFIICLELKNKVWFWSWIRLSVLIFFDFYFDFYRQFCVFSFNFENNRKWNIWKLYLYLFIFIFKYGKSVLTILTIMYSKLILKSNSRLFKSRLSG